MERFNWKQVLDERLDRCLALKIGLEMEQIEGITHVGNHCFCENLVDHALFSCYRAIQDLGDEELNNKLVIHLEILKKLLEVDKY